MAARDGFQPCALDTGAATPMPRWERNLVVAALVVHVVDVGLDLLVVLLFLAHMQWGFFFGTAGVILWAWLVSSLYISFGGGSPAPGDIDDGGVADRLPQFFLNFVQVQIFAEAYRCVFHNGDTDYFHTLRLMEAILESAPNSLVQLYALIVWAGTGDAPEGAGPLLRLSVFASFVSVGLGLAMWEQKVQFRTSSMYVAAVAVMRAFEIASRALTLAIFAGLTHPYGFWWALLIDYGVMLFLIVRHQSVQFTYGLFVALPLVLVSLEPLVWRREDHAVPKDSYYMVRILEFVLMWVLIIHKQDTVDAKVDSRAVWLGCEALALISTLGLYVTLPFVWRIARRHELSRDVADWGEDDANKGLHGHGWNSDSDLSSSGSDRMQDDQDGELPPE
mmetsp:Transcript_23383/g.66156  ORF Transcript_23383/g.66156 Transcript_23383/m.66156 type:complete len:391 (-) Transcript_23383:46-1218(-)|eukprot:CAMPEP_0177343586 /NCGR_PEP_ID=MMETSP0368-20130122/27654_1 /TAXON_ID=447022 ORGANISM="Scrippsiella hangoei-like, Strain SHHI-4" /NCGR_SAMPLE_ID=MMETSP0368 /ASSEMBLY_ACC=CAM_ASM_000363 /LENGTH=390 /DNA_ID=CAMNT_0018805027 /DNA_START=46 /DNA_END=1218 /DNA_ORIENTATION=-